MTYTWVSSAAPGSVADDGVDEANLVVMSMPGFGKLKKEFQVWF